MCQFVGFLNIKDEVILKNQFIGKWCQFLYECRQDTWAVNNETPDLLMDRVLLKHPSKYQHCCRTEVRCKCSVSLSSVSLLLLVVEDRSSKIAQEPSLGEHPRVAQKVWGRLEPSAGQEHVSGTVGQTQRILPVCRNLCPSLLSHKNTGFFFATKFALTLCVSGARGSLDYFEVS